DNVGNPYVAFAINSSPPPHVGASDDQFDVFVEASFDAGHTWNDASDGTGAPYRVTTDHGTHLFSAITAGDPGKVAVAYLGTDAIVPQLPYAKPQIGRDPQPKRN